MHPTLLIGPADWQSQHLPESEFRARRENFWRVADARISHAVVYGDSRNHAELAYLSNFVPKLGPALLLITRHGPLKLMVSGAPNMLAAARRLTWIEQVEPLRDAGATVNQWMNNPENGASSEAGNALAMIGADFMRATFHRPLAESLAGKLSPLDASAALRALMRRKSPRELALMREGCAMLTAATKALAEAHQAGANICAAVLQAENAAQRAGAQDVRSLFSLDGGRTLRPFETLLDVSVEPLQVYLALRHAGYWVDGFICRSNAANPPLARATTALCTIVEMAKPGVDGAALGRLAVETIAPYHAHEITGDTIGSSIGLALDEQPEISAQKETMLEAGCVYTLRVGASDGQNQHAIASALIAVHREGNEILWTSA